MEQRIRERVQAVTEEYLDSVSALGAAVAVCPDNQTLLEIGVGYEDKNKQIPLSADASIYIYSVTKSLLAVMALRLVSQKLLDLDLSVQSYLIDWPFSAAITTRQLLSHTSGLPDYGAAPVYKEALKAAPSKAWSEQDFIRLAVSMGTQFEPGQDWAYSNIGYLFVKRILEQLSGVSVQQLLHKKIISPFQLQQTFFPATLTEARTLTPGYTNLLGQGEWRDMTSLYHPGWVAHGVAISTIPELARTMNAIFTGKLIELSLVQQMVTPAHQFGQSALFGNLGYGLGLFVDTESRYGQVRGHTGEGPGYSVAAFSFAELTDSNTTIAVAINKDKQDGALDLLYRVADVIAT